MFNFSARRAAQLICLCLCLLHAASAYKFLGVLHTAARSHHIVGSALLKELVRQGHEVTVISPFPLKKPMANYHDIDVPGVAAIMDAEKDKLFETLDRSIFENIINYYDMGVRVTEAVLQEPAVKALMQSNQTFDAVICEVFLSEALYGLSEHFKAPLIGLGTFGAHSWNTDMVGSPSPPSYVPNAFLPFTDHMPLLQRIANQGFLTFERVFLNYFYMPRHEAMYKHYFPRNPRSLYDVQKNAALVLLNQHVSIGLPRPYMPNQVEVGGMHINRKRTPLPEDIRKFIEESKHGVIYFSMGSNLKSKSLPLELRQQILSTFRGLKQRVLWKFEDSNLEGKPDNVFISDWFPQDDILAHENVRVFITHGGLLSTTESIYHGKPVIGIPIFGDQFLNMARAETNGFGVMLDFKKLSATTFKAAIERVLSDPTYTQKVRAMSERYRDQPMNPLKLATFWVEHVVRHKGASYLHCAGNDLNFLQYHNLDAMVILYGGLVLVLVLLVSLLCFVLRCACGTRQGKPNKQKRQ